MRDIFGEQDPLEFDEEKVKQLFSILQRSLEGLLGNGVIFAGAERARKTLREHDSAGDLSGSSNWSLEPLYQ